MPDLSFRVKRADIVPFAAASTIAFTLRVCNADVAERIHAVVLRSQVRIDATRSGDKVKRLLRSEATAIVPPFAGETDFAMAVPATYDFSVAISKHIAGRRNAQIPLAFVFSGSVFYEDPAGELRVAAASWESDSAFALPANTWRSLMDGYYPGSAWLTVRQEVYDRLNTYKSDRGLPTWDEVLETLLPEPTKIAEHK